MCTASRRFCWQLSAAATPPIVIQNATILTVTKGTLNGSVLIRDGKIAEVGERVAVPSDAKVIDASGQFVMPGIIDCHSHIAADSINEGSVSVSSMVGIEDVLNPDDIAIYRAVGGRRHHGQHPARQRELHRRKVYR